MNVPVDAVIMAGGRGSRLQPLTNNIPKPLLRVGDKSILERTLAHLRIHGINKVTIAVNYLGEKIEEAIGNGDEKEMDIKYVYEREKKLGTIGALTQIDTNESEDILIMNSDLLTNINFFDMYDYFKSADLDMLIGSIQHQIQVPYGVLLLEGSDVKEIKEKPIHDYYCNAGIYLIRGEFLKYIPKGIAYNATDLIDQLILKGKKVGHYPIEDYWLDIGSHEDFKKAQKDVRLFE